MQMTQAFSYFLKRQAKDCPFSGVLAASSRHKTVWEASIAPYRRYRKYFTSLIKKGMEQGSFVEIDPELASRMIVSTADYSCKAFSIPEERLGTRSHTTAPTCW
jgi:hypothetical protein